MTDMVEKVAEALWRVECEQQDIDGASWIPLGEWAKAQYREKARAAIHALMEPTEEMVEAGIQFFMTRDPSLDSFAKLSRAQWQAMLKAALDD